MNTWRWIGNRQNMSRYDNWNGGTEGSPCAPACLSMWAMTLTAPKWSWKAANKGSSYPYICVSDCALGYVWQRQARKCIKIVRNSLSLKTYSDAAVTCAEDGARLLSLETCDQFFGLQNDLWTQFPDQADRYWLGYYTEGFDSYTTQTRVSTDDAGMIGAAGRKSVLPGGTSNDCTGGKHAKVVMVDSAGTVLNSVPGSGDGFYSELVFTGVKEAKLMLQEFGKVDPSGQQKFLCEKEREWTCGEGSLMFQEHCYTMVEEEANLAWADQVCKDTGGKVLEVETRMHMNIINSWLAVENFTYTDIWLGYRALGLGADAADYHGYGAASAKFDWTSAGLDFATSPVAGSGDCVAMSKADNNLWIKRPCSDSSSYICQTAQLPRPDRLESLFPPHLVLPLDTSLGVADYLNSERPVSQSLVAITLHGNNQSNLQGEAHFAGLPNSYIDIDVSEDFETPVSFGLSVSMWVNVEDIQDGERQWLIDATGSCVEGTEKDHGFMMFLERSAEMTSAGSSVFSLADTCKDLEDGTASLSTPVVTGSTLRLVAVLCDGPQETAGNCAMFTAPESILIEENVWNYFGFVYDALNQSGTFLVNDTFGYHDIAEGRPRESEYFTFDTKNWLMTDAIKGPSVRVASRKFQPFSDPPPASGYESFAGKISCLQLYEGALTPSQMFQQKSCPVTATHPAKFANCPFGFQHYQGQCYLLAVKEKDFAGAEYDCITRSGKKKVLAANLGWHVF